MKIESIFRKTKIINLLGVAGLAWLLTGCATTDANQLIKNAKKNIALNNLLHQEKIERNADMKVKKVKVSDLMRMQDEAAPADPEPKWIHSNYIAEYTREIMQYMPSLSYRKYTTNILSSKTGQTATYTTTFSTLNYELSNYVTTRYYLRMKYLNIIIQEEASKHGHGKNYIQKLKKSILSGFSNWSHFSRTFFSKKEGNRRYALSLVQITYRAIALYNLSSESAKIAVIVHYLQNGEFDKIDEILAKKQLETAKKLASKINKYNYHHMTRRLKTLEKLDINTLRKVSPRWSVHYYHLLPKKIRPQRKKDMKNSLSHLFAIMKKRGLHNAFDIVYRYNREDNIISYLNLAILNSGHKYPLPASFALSGNTCLSAGANYLISFWYKKIDNMAYNVGVMQKLKCPEANTFHKLLQEEINRENK